MAAAGEIDREKAKQVALQIMADVASAMHGAMNFIGDRLGLFKAMKDAGPLTVDQLTARGGLTGSSLQEWLNSMVAAQYLEYDAARHTYLLTPEYAVALADEGLAYFVGSYFQVVPAALSVAPKVAAALPVHARAQVDPGDAAGGRALAARGRRGGRRMRRRPRCDSDGPGVPE